MKNQKSVLSSLLAAFQPPKDSSKKGVLSNEILVNGQKHQITNHGREIALCLSKNHNLDEIQSYEMYWNYQKSVTISLYSQEDLLSKSNVIEENSVDQKVLLS